MDKKPETEENISTKKKKKKARGGYKHAEYRCKAHSKNTKRPCMQFAVLGKNVCKWHGAFSTGPKTKEGKERVKKAVRKSNTKTGMYISYLLPEEEQQFMSQSKDKSVHLWREVNLLTVRINTMLEYRAKILNKLKGSQDLIVYKKHKLKEDQYTQSLSLGETHTFIEREEEIHSSTVEELLKIEKAITEAQNRKAYILKTIQEIEKQQSEMLEKEFVQIIDNITP